MSPAYAVGVLVVWISLFTGVNLLVPHPSGVWPAAWTAAFVGYSVFYLRVLRDDA